VKPSTSRGFIAEVTSAGTMAHLFDSLLCLRGKWKDKRVGFIRHGVSARSMTDACRPVH